MLKFTIMADNLADFFHLKNKINWYFPNVIVGLLPFALRILVVLICPDAKFDYASITQDIILFGLVLNITNMNELTYKRNIIISDAIPLIHVTIMFIITFAGLLLLSYASTYYDELVNDYTIFFISLLLSMVTFYSSCRMIDKYKLYDYDNV